MLQAHGSAPFDPYRTLQLDASAPRDLIAEAYWLLASRARHCDGDEIADLRDAHAFLMDPPSRASFDASHRGASRGRDYYSRLGVAADADAEMIALAHRLALRLASLHARDAIDEAYATLANPYRRARYDAASGRSGVTAFGAATIAPPPPRVRIVANDAPSALVTHVAAIAPPQQIALPLSLSAPEPAERRRASKPRRPQARAKKLTAPVELRPHIAPVLPPPDAPGAPGALVAEVRFIDGPLDGGIVPLPEGVVTLGTHAASDVLLAGSPAADVRIWRLGERYLLRRVNGCAVALDGVPMTLPAAPLEAGTVVEIGAHRFVFAFRRELQPMRAPDAAADDRIAR